MLKQYLLLLWSGLIDDVIRSVNAQTGWKVLVVDHESMRIISAACRMFDIMEEGITRKHFPILILLVVEKIDIDRQPLPKMDAIYLLTPKADSIDKLIKDFSDPKNPQYGFAHLFFTASIVFLLFLSLTLPRSR